MFLTMQFHTDANKRRSFLTMLFASGELRHYCDTMSHDLLLNRNLEVVDLVMVWCHQFLNRGGVAGNGRVSSTR